MDLAEKVIDPFEVSTIFLACASFRARSRVTTLMIYIGNCFTERFYKIKVAFMLNFEYEVGIQMHLIS